MKGWLLEYYSEPLAAVDDLPEPELHIRFAKEIADGRIGAILQPVHTQGKLEWMHVIWCHCVACNAAKKRKA